jgi:hypothetical protein
MPEPHLASWRRTFCKSMRTLKIAWRLRLVDSLGSPSVVLFGRFSDGLPALPAGGVGFSQIFGPTLIGHLVKGADGRPVGTRFVSLNSERGQSLS